MQPTIQPVGGGGGGGGGGVLSLSTDSPSGEGGGGGGGCCLPIKPVGPDVRRLHFINTSLTYILIIS